MHGGKVFNGDMVKCTCRVAAALTVCCLWAGVSHAADPVVESVSTTVKGNEHFTTVEITFTFSDADGDACHIAVFGHDTVTREYFPMVTFLQGDIFNQSFAPGTHTVTWAASLDREESAELTNVVAYVRVSDSGKCAAGRFLVIDVSGGTAASSYPCEYKYYVDVTKDMYKMDKIVLRELPDGSWMGVYEVTQRQYELVTDATPSYFGGNPMRCVEQVSWDDITATGGYTTGFIAALRSKTALMVLDLPNSAQWEYACRAGATNDFSDYTRNRGKGASDEATLTNLGWYGANSGPRTHDAGEKQPNAWGLYDMHGNVCEWTTTPYSSSTRVIRNGYWFGNTDSCRSGNWLYHNPDIRDSLVGFRLALPAGQK